jgi:glycosyltransferase involved in cell wall biosynthesis
VAKLTKVLFLLGCLEGPSKRYRVFNHIEALGLYGVEAEWIYDIDPRINIVDYVSSFSLIVNFRSGFNDRVEALYRSARDAGIQVVYDIDDLVFDEEALDHIDAYVRMDDAEQEEYVEGVRSMRRALLAADYCTTSTKFLQDYIGRATGKRSWVIPFGVNAEQVEIVDHIEPWESRDARFIGYLSGTKSHQRDFAEVAPALRTVLQEYPDAYLKIVGFLDVEEYLPGLENKIVRIPFMDWRDLLIETSTLHVALAPFDVESDFCQAKSELKFVEQALCSVPTIASDISAFRLAIEHGKNGFIAKGENGWVDCLRVLLNDRSYRDQVAREAHLSCLRSYTPIQIGRLLRDTYQEILDARDRGADTPSRAAAVARSKPGLRISWIIPQPFEGSGGHRNIFRAIKYLSEFGHQCTLYMTRDNMRFANGEQVSEFIDREFFPLGVDEVRVDFDRVAACDVLVSTYWTTAYVARENADRTFLNVYFIQDFEPMFFPMGTDYVRALQSYRFGFYHIASGPWPLTMIEKHTGVTGGGFFRFPIDRSIYFANQAVGRSSNRVIFFARPDMPRRCYWLGIEALKIVKERRPELEIVLYGSRKEKLVDASFEFTNLGLTDTIDELGELYRSAALGICFSTTNPSLVPYEMMACGCPVVDLNVNNNEVNYGGSGNSLLVDPDPKLIAEGILDLLSDPARMLDLKLRGMAYARDFPSEVEMARTIEDLLVAEYRRVRSLSAVGGSA